MRKKKIGSEPQEEAKDVPSPEYTAFEELAKTVFKAKPKPKKKPGS